MRVFCTVCDNTYAIYLGKLIKSLLKTNPDFSDAFRVFCDQRLAEVYREELTALYDKFEFIDIDRNKYMDYNKGHIKYYSIEAFNQRDAERVIFLDSDFICTGDISGLYNFSCNIGMVGELRRPCFNAGLIIIGSQFIDKGIYDDLLEYNYDDIKMYGVDQKLYNIYFKGRITEIPREYNTLITEIGNNLANVRLLHYIHKPNIKLGMKHIKQEYIDLWNRI